MSRALALRQTVSTAVSRITPTPVISAKAGTQNTRRDEIGCVGTMAKMLPDDPQRATAPPPSDRGDLGPALRRDDEKMGSLSKMESLSRALLAAMAVCFLMLTVRADRGALISEVDPELSCCSPSSCVPGSRASARLSGIFTGRVEARRSPLETVHPHDVAKQIAPRRVVFLDQLDFPFPSPALHGALALGRSRGIVVRLEIDKPANPKRLVKPSITRSRCSQVRPCEIARHSNVKNAVRLARGDIDPVRFLLRNRHRNSRSTSSCEDPGSPRYRAPAGEASGEVGASFSPTPPAHTSSRTPRHRESRSAC